MCPRAAGILSMLARHGRDRRLGAKKVVDGMQLHACAQLHIEADSLAGRRGEGEGSWASSPGATLMVGSSWVSIPRVPQDETIWCGVSSGAAPAYDLDLYLKPAKSLEHTASKRRSCDILCVVMWGYGRLQP